MSKSTFFDENIKIAKDKLKLILDSQNYKTLTKKQKLIADAIFNTIINSEYLVCFKSNRILAKETGIPVFTINKTRLKLAALDMITIHEMPNGKRLNKSYYLTLKGMKMATFDSRFSLKTKARTYMSNYMAEHDLKKVVKIPDLSIKKLKQNVSMLKSAQDYYVKDTSFKDAESALEESNPKNFDFKNHALLYTCISRYTALSSRLESVGFAVTPFYVTPSFKFSWSTGRLRSRSKSKRLATVRTVFSASSHLSFESWAHANLSTRMLSIIANPAKSDFHAMLYERMIKTYESARQYNALGVALPNGMVCLDIDDVSVYPVLSALLPDGYWTKTKRGFHCYIWDKAGLLDSVKFHGVDILAGDKLVVFSADDNDGKEIYEYISGDLTNIGELPRDFKMWVGGIEEHLPQQNLHPSTLVKYTNNGKFQLPAVIDEMRNDTLYRYGRSLRGQGYTEEYIESALIQLNSDRNIMPNPVSENELHHIIKSAIKKKDRPDFFRVFPFNSKS